MADTITELEVLDQIVDVLGGTSGQYETVVPVLQQIKELLGGGGAVPDGAVTFPKLSQDVQDAIEEGGSGYNPSLSVGRADALTGADETAQWATRESTGTGSATVRSVQGAAVVWEQMVQAIGVGDWRRTANAAISITDGVLAITPSAQYNGANYRTINIVASHKYLLALDYKIPSSGLYVAYTSTSAYFNDIFSSTGSDEWRRGAAIVQTNTGSATGVLNFQDNRTSDWDTWYIRNVQLFDLTLMFGAGNEPSTVAEFERMYPAAYYPYSAPTLKPVQIAGIASTDANGDALDGVEWETQTLRAAGSVADMLYSDHVDVRVGVVDLGTLTWKKYNSSGDVPYYFAASIADIAQGFAYLQPSNLACARYTVVAANWDSYVGDKEICKAIGATDIVMVKDSAYTEVADFKAAMNGVPLYYELATPTTTPISPALPMTYRVQAGGSESIIVPAGEISAAPVLTMAEGESAADVVMDALACIATPDGPVATANHSVGTYLTMQGKLYKVTSAIAVGETITPNTNVSETTVMAELIARTA